MDLERPSHSTIGNRRTRLRCKCWVPSHWYGRWSKVTPTLSQSGSLQHGLPALSQAMKVSSCYWSGTEEADWGALGSGDLTEDAWQSDREVQRPFPNWHLVVDSMVRHRAPSTLTQGYKSDSSNAHILVPSEVSWGLVTPYQWAHQVWPHLRILQFLCSPFIRPSQSRPKGATIMGEWLLRPQCKYCER